MSDRRTDTYELPSSMAPYRGQILDMDAHECIPINLWVEEFGGIAQPFVDAMKAVPAIDKVVPAVGDKATNTVISAERSLDDAEINAHNVWKLKMEAAPGAFDFDRRIQVMDYVGIKSQILYAGVFGLYARCLFDKPADSNFFSGLTGDRRGYARKAVTAYNEWCARLAQKQTRLRPVGLLLGETADELYDAAKQIIDSGLRHIQISTDVPPAGLSPADPQLDRLWALLADSGCSLHAHINNDEEFLKSRAWRDAPAFQGWTAGSEFSLDPWTLCNIHLAVQNFLTTMVLGGVFDRHPTLKFCSAEFTAHWVGPLAENMDRWYAHTPFPSTIGERKLKQRPSDYVRQQVRVATFDFEPVSTYYERYKLEDVYCFATDFPHYEGGKSPMETIARNTAGLSEGQMRKFMIDNAKLVLAD